MRLAILDSNVLNMIQPGSIFEYLSRVPNLELVPSRRAREEAEEDLAKSYMTPLSKEYDAPVSLLADNPLRLGDDPAVISGPTSGMKAVHKLRQTVYLKSTTKKHIDDQEIIGSAIDLWERKKGDRSYTEFFFISGDRGCCNKAMKYFESQNIGIKVLHAKVPGAKQVPGVCEVQLFFRKDGDS